MGQSMVASYLAMGKIVACLSALLVMVRADATIYDDAVYDTGSKAYYRFHNQSATWLNAYTTCVEEGGELAVVTGENKEFLLSHFHFDSVQAFLGFDNWETGSWSTIHDKSLKKTGYENWNGGEPNNAGGHQRCGTMYKNGKLDDYYCNQKLPFICQIYSFPVGYTYYAGTKSYYRFHVNPATWLAAHTTCVKEGGRLAVINSQDEANYFVRNFPSNAKSVFLGLISWEGNGAWVTIHGQSLNETGYEKWAPGGGGAGHRCGTMYRSGKMDDDYCYKKLPFICEKKVTEVETNGNEVYGTTEDPATLIVYQQTEETGSSTTDETGTSTTVETGSNTTDETGTSTTEETGTSTTVETGSNTTDETGTSTTDETGTSTTVETGSNTTDETGTSTTEETATSTDYEYYGTTTADRIDHLYEYLKTERQTERQNGGSTNKEDSDRLKGTMNSAEEKNGGCANKDSGSMIVVTAQNPTEQNGGSAKISEGLQVDTSGSSSPQEVHFALSLVPLLRARTPLARLDAEIDILKYFKQRSG